MWWIREYFTGKQKPGDGELEPEAQLLGLEGSTLSSSSAMPSHRVMLDTNNLEAILIGIMSVDKNKEAVGIFNDWEQTQLDSLVTEFVNLLSSSRHCEVRAMSAILLRKLLTRNGQHKLLDTTLANLKSTIFKCIKSETVNSVLKKLCDTVAEVASNNFDQYRSELIQFLSQCIFSQNPNHQEAGLLILLTLLSKVEMSIPRQLVKNIRIEFYKWIHQCLLSSIDSVRVAAFGVVIIFKMVGYYSEFRPWIITTSRNEAIITIHGLASRNEAMGQEAIKMLIELAENEKLIGLAENETKWCWHHILDSMLEIAESNSFQKGTRHLALEFVLTLNDSLCMHKKSARAVFMDEYFIEQLFTIVINILSDIEEDDPNYHIEEYPDGSISYLDGQDIWYRVLPNINISNFFSRLQNYSTTTEWQKKYAMLFALRELIVDHPKMIGNSMDQIVVDVLKACQCGSRMVRYVVIDIFGQLLTNFGPQLKVQYCRSLMPILIAALDDDHPRLQVLAAKLFSSIFKIFEFDILNSERFSMLVKTLYNKQRQQTCWDALKLVVGFACKIKEPENGILYLKYQTEPANGNINYLFIRYMRVSDKKEIVEQFYIYDNEDTVVAQLKQEFY